MLFPPYLKKNEQNEKPQPYLFLGVILVCDKFNNDFYNRPRTFSLFLKNCLRNFRSISRLEFEFNR